MSAGPELFIYWRCRRADFDSALAAAGALQAHLVDSHPSLTTGLFLREDATALAEAESATVMETYAAPPVGIDASLQAHITAEGNRALAAWLQGPRHVEVFRRAL